MNYRIEISISLDASNKDIAERIAEAIVKEIEYPCEESGMAHSSEKIIGAEVLSIEQY